MTLNIDLDDLEFEDAIELKQRHISVEQMRTFEGYMAEIFDAMGMNVSTPGTEDTPKRFLKAMLDATEGYDGDPKLIKVFPAEHPNGTNSHLSQVIEGPIHFFSLCEHHAFPFFGQAYVGYIANEHIIGLSKLTRLVRVFAKRFSVQERITQQIASSLEAILQPQGVAVYLEANHLCMAMRGVRESSALTRTTAWRGEYEHNAELRSEFFSTANIRP